MHCSLHLSFCEDVYSRTKHWTVGSFEACDNLSALPFFKWSIRLVWKIVSGNCSWFTGGSGCKGKCPALELSPTYMCQTGRSKGAFVQYCKGLASMPLRMLACLAESTWTLSRRKLELLIAWPIFFWSISSLWWSKSRRTSINGML